jgi:rod shape-determining protein MreD
MRSPVFIAALIASLLLDSAFLEVLSIGGVRPWLYPVVLAFVCFNASKTAARWGALGMGVLYDLVSPVAAPGGSTIVVLGPNAIGCLLAAAAAIQLRGVVFKRNPVAVGVLSGALLLIHQVGWFAAWTVRGWLGDPVPWTVGEVGGAMLASFWAALATALLGIPVSVLLDRIEVLWGFPPVGSVARRV